MNTPPLDALASAISRTAAMLREVEARLASDPSASDPKLQQIDHILQRLDALAQHAARLAPDLPFDAAYQQLIAELPLESLRDELAARASAPPRLGIELF